MPTSFLQTHSLFEDIGLHPSANALPTALQLLRSNEASVGANGDASASLSHRDPLGSLSSFSITSNVSSRLSPPITAHSLSSTRQFKRVGGGYDHLKQPASIVVSFAELISLVVPNPSTRQSSGCHGNYPFKTITFYRPPSGTVFLHLFFRVQWHLLRGCGSGWVVSVRLSMRVWLAQVQHCFDHMVLLDESSQSVPGSQALHRVVAWHSGWDGVGWGLDSRPAIRKYRRVG